MATHGGRRSEGTFSARDLQRAFDPRHWGTRDARETQVWNLLAQTNSTGSERTKKLSWKRTAETFVLARGQQSAPLSIDVEVPVLEGRLFFMISPESGKQSTRATRYFTTDDATRYVPFCADFG